MSRREKLIVGVYDDNRSPLMPKIWLASLVVAFGGPAATAQGMLETRLAEPTIYEASSRKGIAELEFCVANAISATPAIPSGAYRDGNDRVVIFGNRIAEVKVFLIVTLLRVSDRTHIEVRGRNEDALKGFQPTLEACI